jgi:hypothetical protein
MLSTDFPSNQHTSASRWRLALLALVLVLGQTLLLEHRAAHHGLDSDDGVCEVCLIGGGLDQAPVNGDFSLEFLPSAANVALTASVIVAFRAGRPQLARAPPHFSFV